MQHATAALAAPLLIAVLAAVLGSGRPALAQENWPQFRGPTGQGIAESENLPLRWSESDNVKWKVAIPGQGWSSPVVWGDQVWMTTATDEGKSLRAICVDRNTGKIVHDVEVFAVQRLDRKNRFNSYASPTPVIEAGRVYVSFGTYGSAALDTATGQVLWRNTEDLKINHMEGPGSSPILYKNLFILHCDGTDNQFIIALDKQTGKPAWKTTRSTPFPVYIVGPLRKAFSTPLVIHADGRDQLISVAARRLFSYDPATGQELWHVNLEGPAYSNAPRPLFDGQRLYICTGYNTAQLWAINIAGARGDATETHIGWKHKRGAPLKPSPILVGDHLYFVSDTGMARCLDSKTGKELWAERLEGNYSASPIAAGSRIYFFSEPGPATVIEAGPTFKKLAENHLESGCLATPAVAGNALFIRTKTHLYSVGAGSPRPASPASSPSTP